MTEDQLKEIESRAKAATQGEWRAIPLEPHSDCLSIYGDDIVCRLWWLREEDHTTRIDDNCEANAAHIAGMSPSTTLALVEEVRRLREALKPFALEADEWDGPAASAPDTLVPCIGTYQDTEMADAMFTVGDLRRARAVLGEAGRE